MEKDKRALRETMAELGRWIAGVGLGLLLGGLFVLAGRLGLPLGRLPGDFVWRGRHSVVFAPLGTSLLLSLLLSLALAAWNHFRK